MKNQKEQVSTEMGPAGNRVDLEETKEMGKDVKRASWKKFSVSRKHSGLPSARRSPGLLIVV